jgi:hypothetical protein
MQVNTEYSLPLRRRQSRRRLLRLWCLERPRIFPDSEFPVFSRFLLPSLALEETGEGRPDVLQTFAKPGLS